MEYGIWISKLSAIGVQYILMRELFNGQLKLMEMFKNWWLLISVTIISKNINDYWRTDSAMLWLSPGPGPHPGRDRESGGREMQFTYKRRLHRLASDYGPYF